MNNQNSPERSSKRPRTKRKPQYRIRNWPEYNAALFERGSLTVWLDEEAMDGWSNRQKSGKRGASCTYTDSAILCVLTLQVVYRLPLRATEGLLILLFILLGLDLPVPDYSTLCRRRQRLSVPLRPTQNCQQNLHLVVDSTGFKVYGEGEWKVRVHGWSKHRTWRKLHLGIDQASGQVRAAVVTTPYQSDKAVLPVLLDQVQAPITQISGDSGYDYVDCYEAIAKRDAKATISPPYHRVAMVASIPARNGCEAAMPISNASASCKAVGDVTRTGGAESGRRKAATIGAAWWKRE